MKNEQIWCSPCSLRAYSSEETDVKSLFLIQDEKCNNRGTHVLLGRRGEKNEYSGRYKET